MDAAGLINLEQRVSVLEQQNKQLRQLVDETASFALKLADSMRGTSESLTVEQLIALNGVAKAMKTAQVDREADMWRSAQEDLNQ